MPDVFHAVEFFLNLLHRLWHRGYIPLSYFVLRVTDWYEKIIIIPGPVCDFMHCQRCGNL